MLTDGRRTDDGVTGVLIAHLGAFGSGELIIYLNAKEMQPFSVHFFFHMDHMRLIS